MCATCGCSDGGGVRVSTMHAHPHTDHAHPHQTDDPASGDQQDGEHTEAPGEHDHQHGKTTGGRSEGTRLVAGPSRTQLLEVAVLAKNEGLAAANRRWLHERGIIALNLMSSPGSGKTTLLVRTLTDLADTLSISVIEGDQETLLDADRIHATGAPVVQVNTGSGCHLDAEMMRMALDELKPQEGSVLFVENVGNLVCPAMFDLGEAAKVVVISVTEGADKPLKYPQMFAGVDLMIVNKSDLLPYVDFDVQACIRFARQVNPRLQALVVSATTGEGLDQWYDWVRTKVNEVQAPPR
jgi:hydrogenase nickel incorporation protein HypB